MPQTEAIMDKYQGSLLIITTALIVGAALSETFLKVQWSPGLMAIIGLPLTAVFAGKVAQQIKKASGEEVTRVLEQPTQEAPGAGVQGIHIDAADSGDGGDST